MAGRLLRQTPPRMTPRAGAAGRERPGDPHFMQSLARGLAVIRAFETRAALSIAEVARITGLSRAAARRCLYTLCELGYAAQTEATYHLTPAILALGYTYVASAPWAWIAQPVLERVSEHLHESSSLALLDGHDIVYVARAATKRILSISLSVGSRLPAGATSMGRVLLAYAEPDVQARYLARAKLVQHTPSTIVDRAKLKAELDRVRTQGFALVDQELETGLRSLAVPVRGPDGQVVAAINVGVHVGRAETRTLVREVLPVLREAAADIAAGLGRIR